MRAAGKLPLCVPAKAESATRFGHTVTCRSNPRIENTYTKEGCRSQLQCNAVTTRSALREPSDT